jgi:glycosyltransferase involved in cell wall biosynthesis
MNDNFYRSSGVAIAIRRIASSLPEIDWFFASCFDDSLREDVSWITASRFERFDLKATNPWKVFREGVRFRQWIRDNDIDLVHSHHRRIAAILQLFRVPVLYTGQLVFPYERWFHLLAPRKMTAITPSVAKNLLSTTGRPVLACISNPALFPATFLDFEATEVADRACCIARLDPVKGHVHLLKAWKILHDRGYSFHLDLIGEGELRSQLTAQAERDGISHLVHFLGFTSDVHGAIKKTLFAVLVSEYEGQGIVTLEAASASRPTLVTAVPGSVDLIPPDAQLPNGVEFGNAQHLADALEAWFANPKTVREEGQRFFKFLSGSCDPVTVGSQYKQVYRQLILENA